MQLSKTIYFSDYPSSGRTRSGLTLSFSQEDDDLYSQLQPLSSYSVRSMIGYDSYHEIKDAAANADMQVSTFVREILRDKIKPSTSDPDECFFRIQSTFQGGKGSPLHDWYPYLEGYSPEFVSTVIDTFAPEARNILDPFCGSGTTALVTAKRGGVGYYAEVNPVCQYVIEAKSLALTLSIRERHRVAERLHDICDDLGTHLKTYLPDQDLSSTFNLVFGSRPFFEEKNFDNVLRIRSFADTLEREDPVVGRFFNIAVLRSLVACSLLVRRGDLRFRTEKERTRGIPDILDEISNGLELVASDLVDSESAPGRTNFVTDDARLIKNFMPSPVDAIITSPPYLNGTNYFRNTKIELWYLRHLSLKSDLRGFRDAAITSGINDVTRGKLKQARKTGDFEKSELLQKTLRDLDEAAYDSRIGAMVENYFYDMHDVLTAFPEIMNQDGVVAIDLGDSVYSGVHVKTDEILAGIMEDIGFDRKDNIVLRKRQSRDGTSLSQTLQVFKLRPQKSRGSKSILNADRLDGWFKFRSNLPHQTGEMAKRNWGHGWHSMCSYQGKLKPAIARCLVDALMPSSGGRLLDTFSGVGTIPLEARLCGHTSFGFDISPAAVAISRAKIEPINWEEVNQILEDIEGHIKDQKEIQIPVDRLNKIRFNGPLPSYFNEDTLREILISRQYFQNHKPDNGSLAVVFSSLLHILHGNRPYALSRRSHPITPFSPTGPSEYRALMPRLRQKVARIQKASSDVCNVSGKSFFQDVTKTWPHEVDQLDAIITSPPFFDSTRFYSANWMRLWFAGWELEDFSKKSADFVDEKQKKSFSIYDNIFKQANERLKTGGFFAVHVGKSTKCDMAAALQQIGERYLHFVDWFSESVEHCESHGIRDKGTVTHHQYLLFEKLSS